MLIKDLDDTQKEVVRKIISKGIRLGWDNQKITASLKNKIGLDPRYAAAVENFRDGEIAGGVPPGVADRHAQVYAGRLRKARAARIVGYEVQKALNDAQRLLWQQEQEDGNVSRWAVRKWTLHKDERLCKTCRPMNGKRASLGPKGGYNVPGVGHVIGPPIHPNCRCSEDIQDEGIVKAQQYPELWWDLSKHGDKGTPGYELLHPGKKNRLTYSVYDAAEHYAGNHGYAPKWDTLRWFDKMSRAAGQIAGGKNVGMGNPIQEKEAALLMAAMPDAPKSTKLMYRGTSGMPTEVGDIIEWPLASVAMGSDDPDELIPEGRKVALFYGPVIYEIEPGVPHIAAQGVASLDEAVISGKFEVVSSDWQQVTLNQDALVVRLRWIGDYSAEAQAQMDRNNWDFGEDEEVSKHLLGLHDQKAHGRRGNGFWQGTLLLEDLGDRELGNPYFAPKNRTQEQGVQIAINAIRSRLKRGQHHEEGFLIRQDGRIQAFPGDNPHHLNYGVGIPEAILVHGHPDTTWALSLPDVNNILAKDELVGIVAVNERGMSRMDLVPLDDPEEDEERAWAISDWMFERYPAVLEGMKEATVPVPPPEYSDRIEQMWRTMADTFPQWITYTSTVEAEVAKHGDKGTPGYYLLHPPKSFDHIGATWRDNAKTEAAKKEFDELPDDALITVYHGTTEAGAEGLLSAKAVAVPEGHETDLPTKAKTSLYVAPTIADAENYGKKVVALVVRKGDLQPSPEAKSNPKVTLTTAFFNSFDGAVLPPGHIFSQIEVSKHAVHNQKTHVSKHGDKGEPGYELLHPGLDGLKSIKKWIPKDDWKRLDKFGVKVAFHPVTKGKPPAEYDWETKTIRVYGESNDSTLLHETGHALDHSLGWISESGAYKALVTPKIRKNYKIHAPHSTVKEVWAIFYTTAMNPDWGWAGENLDDPAVQTLLQMAKLARTHRDEINKHAVHNQLDHGRDKRKMFGALAWIGPGGHPMTSRTEVGDTFEIMFAMKVKNNRKARAVLGGRIKLLVGGKGPRQGAIDVISNTYAIELKTMNAHAKRRQVSMEPDVVAAKQRRAEEMGLPGALVAQIVDQSSRTVTVWVFLGGFTKSGGSGKHEPETQWIKAFTYKYTEDELIEAHDRGYRSRNRRGIRKDDVDEWGDPIKDGDTVIELIEADGELRPILYIEGER